MVTAAWTDGCAGPMMAQRAATGVRRGGREGGVGSASVMTGS